MDIFSEIKTRVPFESVCKDHNIEFKNNKAICPFHDDKKPSFSLHPSKQYAKCFGCDVSVDAIELEYQLGKH